jgi:hypothetical protein
LCSHSNNHHWSKLQSLTLTGDWRLSASIELGSNYFTLSLTSLSLLKKSDRRWNEYTHEIESDIQELSPLLRATSSTLIE